MKIKIETLLFFCLLSTFIVSQNKANLQLTEDSLKSINLFVDTNFIVKNSKEQKVNSDTYKMIQLLTDFQMNINSLEIGIKNWVNVQSTEAEDFKIKVKNDLKNYEIQKTRMLKIVSQDYKEEIIEVISLEDSLVKFYKLVISELDSFKSYEDPQIMFPIKIAEEEIKNNFIQVNEKLDNILVRFKKAHNEENNRKEERNALIKYGLLFSLLFVISISLSLYFVIRSRKRIKAQHKEITLQRDQIEEQKHYIEENRKELLDSIHYARRIQDAIIAHKDFMDKYLDDYFVFYHPKDIVSGDFYWATKNSEYFYLAVCDSTGHGVPGAFMSLLNISFINEAITEKSILEPNKVFDYVRGKLTNTISKYGQRDGFDGILLRINIKTKEIDYAAANNAPVIISNGELKELPKNRLPVGASEKNANFDLFTIDKDERGILYLYSDGFADQFGGPKGKKYKYKQLNELLVKTAYAQTDLQINVLLNEFNNWKGNLEQVDDVLVVGIRI